MDSQQHQLPKLPFSLETINQLDGREFAMLSPTEVEVYRFVRDQGRKFGIGVEVDTSADKGDLARANKQEAEKILTQARSKLSIVFGVQRSGFHG